MWKVAAMLQEIERKVELMKVFVKKEAPVVLIYFS